MPAQAALESDRPIHRIWCTPEMRFQPRFMQLLREAKAGGVLVEEVTWARLGQLTDGAVHQGIVLQAAAADTLDLGSLIDGCRTIGEPPLLMALDGITDPHNLGAIVRSAEALGAHGLVLPQRRSAGLTGSVAKVAAGALEHLPVARVVNLNRSLETLKEEGYRVVGLAGEGGVSPERGRPGWSAGDRHRLGGSGPLDAHPQALRPAGAHSPARRHPQPQCLGGHRDAALRGGPPRLDEAHQRQRPGPRMVRPQMPTTAASSNSSSQATTASETDAAVEPDLESAIPDLEFSMPDADTSAPEPEAGTSFDPPAPEESSELQAVVRTSS